MSIGLPDALTGLRDLRYQTFGTEIADERAATTARFLVYPSATRRGSGGRLIPCPDFDEVRHTFPSARHGKLFGRPTSAQRDDSLVWTRAIAATVDPSVWAEPGSLNELQIPKDLQRFAEYLYTEPIMPFRSSPISGRALAALMAISPGAGAGGLVGAFAGMHDSLLMLLTVPGGMIVGGSAMGIATALEQGLHDRVLQLIVPPKDPPEQESKHPDDA